MSIPRLVLSLGCVAALSVNATAAEVALADGSVTSQVTNRFTRPIPMGTSCGNTPSLPFIYTGTCGMRVRSLVVPGLKLILSNNHVLGTQGPDLCPGVAAPLNTVTLQPGTLDIGSDPGATAYYAVAVVGGFVPLDPAPAASNLVDAAVSITNEQLADTSILNLGDPNPVLGFAAPGMAVTKTGRTTDTTNGTVSTVNSTVYVSYGGSCGIYRFVRQVVITPGTFSSGGDSGSVVLETATKTPVGLLFAGSATQTIANPIHAVYLRLGIFVDTPSTSAQEVTVPDIERQVAAHGASSRRLQVLENIQARAEPRLFANPGVVGVGIGQAGPNEELGLVVYTVGEPAAVARNLPSRTEGVPVRVVSAPGGFRAYNW